MVVAMSRDIRVLVIKLADRLHNMRTLHYLRPDKQSRIAAETLEIFAPLAHRLGMNTIKWELEDLSFGTLYPKVYDEIVRLVAEAAPSRDQYLSQVIDQVQADLRAAKIKGNRDGTTEALLLDLPKDGGSGARLPGDLRLGRPAHPGRVEP
jgi:GTP pyrophosphokinase